MPANQYPGLWSLLLASKLLVIGTAAVLLVSVCVLTFFFQYWSQAN